MPTPILAAGGIIWRHVSDSRDIEVLLVHRPRYRDWTFPKGKLDKGESMLEAAVREVAEETGLSAMLGHRLPAVRYRTVDGPKEVTYWTMQPSGGAFVPSREVDKVRWVPLSRARKLLTYGHDRRVAREMFDLPPTVVRVILVRHAHAGHRGNFDGPDIDRPLSSRGRHQAARMGLLVSAFGPTRILSAPALRCVQTVQPLAEAAGLTVEETAIFSEDYFATQAQPAFDRLVTDLASPDDVTVIVSQGGVIPSLISRLAGGTTASIVPPVPATGVIAAKASVWALACGAGRLRADYYPPLKR